MAGVILSLDDVRAAAERLSGVAHRTPVLTSRTLDERTGATAFLKAESLQRGGAFKFRGAYNDDLVARPRSERAAGVVAYSSGNHAQAVALAARLVGTSATILMPADTPAAKLDATRGYGAEVVTYDRYTEDREALGAALAEERGLVLVPPYEHPLVMAGQGTAALELLEEAPDLDVLLVPVGGGGLIAGCATAAKAIRPGSGRRRRARGRRRHAPLARGRRAGADPRPAHDRRRPAGRHPRRADLRGEPSSRR